MTRFKPYKSKKPRQVEIEPLFKERPDLVAALAIQVMDGRICEEQASDIINVCSIEDFREYCAKWLDKSWMPKVRTKYGQ